MNTNANGNPPGQPQEGAPDTAPQLNCLTQYIKDFSFENPNAPGSIAGLQSQPNINVNVNVAANQLGDNDYEVTLTLDGRAEANGTLLYNFELTYGGAFRMFNMPQDAVQQILMVDCPHLLFPFAREIVASSVGNSGFPPLLLGAINFFALFQQRIAELQAEAPAAGAPN
ncbi:MAG TPA: protein-export chaperone SecB [Xanthobacteraceae bacterium]|nr:protein-export chaperone SecB [Xanthobacteraceae bacterium]